ncbi:hypothetical protein HFD84_01765 [Brevibacillus laterosporus]|nr:hypothetical protein [Brevibacillus laterosporus]
MMKKVKFIASSLMAVSLMFGAQASSAHTTLERSSAPSHSIQPNFDYSGYKIVQKNLVVDGHFYIANLDFFVEGAPGTIRLENDFANNRTKVIAINPTPFDPAIIHDHKSKTTYKVYITWY